MEEGAGEIPRWRATRERSALTSQRSEYYKCIATAVLYHRSVGEPAEGSFPRDPNPTSQQTVEHARLRGVYRDAQLGRRKAAPRTYTNHNNTKLKTFEAARALGKSQTKNNFQQRISWLLRR